MNEDFPIQEQTESIELTVNAKGNYQWSIKLRSKLMSDDDLKRLDQINEYLTKKYGLLK